MPRELVLKARLDRNAALVETMILAASADGKFSRAEKEALLRRVAERPEFEGTRPDELTALIEGAVVRLSSAPSLEDILSSLRHRLPDHANRLLAFGLAAAIAFDDKRASKEELGLLKTVQAALGISEEEVERVITAIEGGGALNEALGEPVDRLFAEVMVLAAISDGKLDRDEAQAIVETLAGDPTFSHLGPQDAKGMIRDSLEALTSEGLGGRLTVLARGLSTHKQRLKAFKLATRVADASGGLPARGTTKVLDLLQATFGLADDEVARAHLES